MSREDALKIIDDSIIVEELAIPVYQKHLNSALFWSGFDTEDVNSIRFDLELLTKESKEHIIILNQLKKIAERGK